MAAQCAVLWINSRIIINTASESPVVGPPVSDESEHTSLCMHVICAICGLKENHMALNPYMSQDYNVLLNVFYKAKF